MSLLCSRDVRVLDRVATREWQGMHGCAACRGLWLPPSVVFAILGHRPVPPARSASDKPAFAAACCPEDGAGMYLIRHRGVEIDVCSHCRGVWLDAGELDRLRPGDEDDEDSDDDSILEDVLDVVLDGDGSGAARARSARASKSSLDDTDVPSAAAPMPTRAPTSLEVEAASPRGGFSDLATLPEVSSEAGSDLVSLAGDALQSVAGFVGEALSGW